MKAENLIKLKDEMVQKYYDEYQENYTLSYHVFEMDSKYERDYFTQKEDEALEFFENLKKDSTDNTVHIALHFAPLDERNTFEESLAIFERSQREKNIIEDVRFNVESYHDSENNYIIRIFDEDDEEKYEFFVFNRTEKEAVKEYTQEISEGHDYSVRKFTMEDYIHEAFGVDRSVSIELFYAILA